jgi:1-phosphofructokinase family hexose kinase
MILCITPNPAVDRTARVARLAVGRILRPVEVLVLPGGKGNNVARAARALGADVRTSGVVGGHAGRWIVDELARDGLNPQFVESAHESRTTYVVAGDDGRSVMVYEKGPAQPNSAFDELLSLMRNELLDGCAFVIIAGSLPLGVDPQYFGRLVAACNNAGVPCLVDSWGPGLLVALAQRPSFIKATSEELVESGVGPARGNPVQLARSGVAAGAGTCIVTVGARGAVACDGADCWRLTVPPQPAVNSVGAGDAFTAGLVLALGESRPLEEALVYAGAAGAASVHKLGAGFLDPETVRGLAGQVHVRRVGR